MSNQLWIAPADTPIDTNTPWTEFGYLSEEGIETKIETVETIDDWGSPIRTDITALERTVTVTMNPAGHRTWMKYVFDIYRLPGDKPLIHKGRKP